MESNEKYQRVYEAADALFREKGRLPTVNSVRGRARVGMATALEGFQQWKVDRFEGKTSQTDFESGVPIDLLNIVRRAGKQMWEACDRQVKQSYDEQVTSLTADFETKLMEEVLRNQRLELRLDDALAQAAEVEKEKAAVESTLSDKVHELELAEQKLSQLQAALTQCKSLEAECNELKQALSQHQAELNKGVTRVRELEARLESAARELSKEEERNRELREMFKELGGVGDQSKGVSSRKGAPPKKAGKAEK